MRSFHPVNGQLCALGCNASDGDLCEHDRDLLNSIRLEACFLDGESRDLGPARAVERVEL